VTIRLFASLTLALGLAACGQSADTPQPPIAAPAAPNSAARPAATPNPRHLRLMLINDVYRIEGLDNGTLGGLARVRSLRRELEAEGPELLLLHAGDLLYPSLLSRRLDGEQMIDILNRLDGDPEGFDPNLFVTFGNHEFDKAALKDAAKLRARLHASQFTWLSSNVDFARGADGQPLVDGPHLLPYTLIERGGLRIGLFGLTIDSRLPAYVQAIRPPEGAARATIATLRAQGAELVIALTHLTLAQDRALLEALGEQGPDLILGGHEHERHEAWVGRRPIFKADADARSALVAEVELGAEGPTVRASYHDLDASVPPDPLLAARVDHWLGYFQQLECDQEGRTAGCLDQVLGQTHTPLVAEELLIRRQETNLGDWLMDVARTTFAAQGAQIAFINAGSLRLNQDLPPGPITRRHLLELFAYPAPLYLVRLDGATLQRVVEQAVSRWPGEGRWLQISGFAFRHDTEQGTVSDLSLLTADGPRPIRPDESLLAVTNGFLLDESGDQDGYRMLNLGLRVAPEAVAPDLRERVVEALAEAGAAGIAPTQAGRICQHPAADGPCLLDAVR